MQRLTRAMNVPEDKRSQINFKSEFVLKQMMITRGKKHYAALITHQDGHAVGGGKGKLITVGLMIKKTSFSRVAGEYLENAMNVHILSGKTVDRIGFLRSIVRLEERIHDSLRSGYMVFSTPGVVNRISGYDRPMSMPVVRGMLAWNAACPDNPIREGDKLNILPLKINSDITAFEALMNELRDSGDEDGFRALTEIGSVFFWAPGENLLNGNLNWLAVPKTVKVLPAWAISLVDANALVSTNLAAALPILEAIDVVTLRLPSPETYSTTIHF